MIKRQSNKNSLALKYLAKKLSQLISIKFIMIK